MSGWVVAFVFAIGCYLRHGEQPDQPGRQALVVMAGEIKRLKEQLKEMDRAYCQGFEAGRILTLMDQPPK